MAVNTQINNWIARAKVVTDYYTLFIRAWIPYNAWYMHNFFDEDSNPKRDRDSAIIGHINSTSNRYRDKIKSLLRGTDSQSIEFRSFLGKLHSELEANPIPDFEKRITFSTINLTRNTQKTHTQSFKNFTYSVRFDDTLPKTSKRWFLEVQRKVNNQTIHRIELFNWSEEELENEQDFISIPDIEKKNQLRDAFSKINPRQPIQIIVQPKRTRGGNFRKPNDSFAIEESLNLYFTNDFDLVSKVIVQLLYELRCKLFHGELDPIDSNLSVYEYAYKIQNILIKELR